MSLSPSSLCYDVLASKLLIPRRQEKENTTDFIGKRVVDISKA
jgi:hypothetical protein